MASKSVETSPESKREFFELANELNEAAKPTPWYKSIPAAAAKGLIEGTIGLGQAFSGGTRGENDQQANENRQTVLDTLLPSNQGLSENIASKTGELLPLVATGGGGALNAGLRSLGAAAGSQTAKEFGFGELTQAAAELPALIGPDLARLIPTVAGSRQAQLADFARAQGLSEEQLALALGEQGRFQQAMTKVAPKDGRTGKAFDKTKQGLGDIWQDLRGSPAAQTQMNTQDANGFINDLSNKITTLPAEQRLRIQQDYNDLIQSPMTGEDLINFWQDLNYYIPKGEKGLGILKEDISNALNKISPELGNDFKLTNDLYANYSKLSAQMKPDIIDKFLTYGEYGALAFGLASGNYPLLAKTIGPIAARTLAREMIINPRLQNLSQRFMNAARRSTPAMTKKAYDLLVLEVAKSNAEAAAQLSEFDAEAFAESLSKKEKGDSSAENK